MTRPSYSRSSSIENQIVSHRSASQPNCQFVPRAPDARHVTNFIATLLQPLDELKCCIDVIFGDVIVDILEVLKRLGGES